MRRRTFLQLAGLLGAAVATGCAAAPQRPPTSVDRTFFVSTAGDDAGSGRTPDAAWRSVAKVNAELAAGRIAGGDAVRFERGQTFFGKLRPTAGDGRHITFGGYRSEGAAAAVGPPVISSYKLLNIGSGWTRTDAETWSVELSAGRFGNTHTGYDGSVGGAANIGFLKIDGGFFGRRRETLAELAEQWDFHCAGERLHVRSGAHPMLRASDIRASCGTPCLVLRDWISVEALRFEGGSGHGIQGSGSNIRILDNELAELGGAQLGPQARYGNGIEVWIGSSEILVEGNRIHDVYDAALTIQGSADSALDGWRNIVLRNNLTFRNGQSLEFWSGAQGHDSPGFDGCLVEGNVCLFAGYGWSAGVRPDTDRGVHLLTYGWELPADLTVRRNVFYDGRSGYRFQTTDPAGMTLTDNVVLLRPQSPLQSGDDADVGRNAGWTAARDNDLGSTFVALPATAPVDVHSALREVRRLVPDKVAQLCRAGAARDLCS